MLTRKGVDSTVRLDLTAARGTTQLQSHSKFEREPLLAEIPEQGFVLATVSGTVYIYSRIGNNRYKVALTLVV